MDPRELILPHFKRSVAHVLFPFGSHLYGTDRPDSDLDYKAVYLPNPVDIVLQRTVGSESKSTKKDPNLKNVGGDTDLEAFSLHGYLRLLLEGQTAQLEMLFCPTKLLQFKDEGAGGYSNFWSNLRLYKDRFLHKNTDAFAYYCKNQANKYGIKGSRVAAFRTVKEILDRAQDNQYLQDLEQEFRAAEETTEFIRVVVQTQTLYQGVAYHKNLSVGGKMLPLSAGVKHCRPIVNKWFTEYGDRALQAERNEGLDWKALMHAVRVAGQAKELLLTKHIEFPRPNAAQLKKIRAGEVHFKEVEALIEQGLNDLEDAKNRSELPDEPDEEFAEQFVVDCYKTVIEGSPMC